MKKKFTKKLSFKAISVETIGQAAGGRTLTWGCWSTPDLGCTKDCDPDAPTGTVAVTDSCNPDANCY